MGRIAKILGIHTDTDADENRNIKISEHLSQEIDLKLRQNKIGRKAYAMGWRKNIVEDCDAPSYYSQVAIYTFSIFFSVLFGSFLLAANNKDAGRSIWPVLFFGFSYTAIIIMILNGFPVRMSYLFIANALGAILMYDLFWKRIIGAETKYRAKPIWKPLIIASIIYIPYILLLLTDPH